MYPSKCCYLSVIISFVMKFKIYNFGQNELKYKLINPFFRQTGIMISIQQAQSVWDEIRYPMTYNIRNKAMYMQSWKVK